MAAAQLPLAFPAGDVLISATGGVDSPGSDKKRPIDEANEAQVATQQPPHPTDRSLFHAFNAAKRLREEAVAPSSEGAKDETTTEGEQQSAVAAIITPAPVSTTVPATAVAGDASPASSQASTEQGRRGGGGRSFVPSIDVLRLEAVVARVGRPNKSGSPTITLYNEDTQQGLAVKFAEPPNDEPCALPWGLDTSNPNRELPSFMGGPASTRLVEDLNMAIAVNEKQRRFVEGLEEHIKRMAAAECQKWFGRAMKEDDISRIFISCLKAPPAGSGKPFQINTKLVLSAPQGQETLLTDIKLVHAVDAEEPSTTTRPQAETGRGWAWVQPRASVANFWRGCDVWPTLEFRSVWYNGKNFGLSVRYHSCIIREVPRAADYRNQPYAPAFPEDMVRRCLL